MSADNSKPVSTADLARYFGVTVATVRKWVRQKRVPFIRPSRRTVRFHIPDIEAALAGGKKVDNA